MYVSEFLRKAVAKAMLQTLVILDTVERGENAPKALNMPAITSKRSKYYTPNEVNIHNTLKDLWVSFLGKVYDLTPMCEKHAGKESFRSSTSDVRL